MAWRHVSGIKTLSQAEKVWLRKGSAKSISEHYPQYHFIAKATIRLRRELEPRAMSGDVHQGQPA